jgi:ferredoxin-type protein NapG
MSKPVRGAKSAPSHKRRQESRREFLRSTALAAGVMGAALFGYYPVAQGLSLRLRPPGAIKSPLDEQQFLASCIKCGQCVQVCPVNALKLTDIGDGFGIGTPYIDAREQACDFSCDGLQCVLACPTGALTHDLDYPADSRMGFARLDKPTACLAMQGKGFKGIVRGAEFDGKLRFDEIDRWNPIALRDHPYDLEICDLCVRQCPIEIRIAQCEAGKPPSNDPNQCPPKHAIALEPVAGDDGLRRMRPVVLEGCVGCGVCEMICPVTPAAIVIDIDNVTASV